MDNTVAMEKLVNSKEMDANDYNVNNGLRRHYIKQKREKHDYCNICKQLKDLTWDHVPPQSIQLMPNVYANTLFNGMPTNTNHMKHYQSGIKYRTICADCNNVVLGQNDSEYKAFIKKVSNALSKLEETEHGIDVRDSITISIRINRVLRAICGHFLAMKSTFDDVVPVDNYLREYVLDNKMVFSKYRIYTWFYPYPTILNSRDFIVQGHYEYTHPKSFISVMSAFPLAFLLTAEEENCLLDDIGSYSTADIDEEVELELCFRTLLLNGSDQPKHFAWPTDVANGDEGALFVMGGQEVVEGSRLGITDTR